MNLPPVTARNDRHLQRPIDLDTVSRDRKSKFYRRDLLPRKDSGKRPIKIPENYCRKDQARRF